MPGASSSTTISIWRRQDGVNHIDITVADGDPVFPDGSVIRDDRSVIDPEHRTPTAHPATAVNAITGWLDASMVYGSDAATAASLRLADGHMKTSAGGNLPIDKTVSSWRATSAPRRTRR